MATLELERRAFTADLEVRETKAGLSISGYAARFDSPSRGEVVRASAFNKTLAERADVRLLVNHDGMPLARTKSKTLGLAVDAVGLKVNAPNLDASNPTVQELASAMRRQDLDQMSFAFVDRTPEDQRYDAVGIRNIREVELFDVSMVTFPWYEDTHAEMNALDQAFTAIRNGAALTPEQRALLTPALGLNEPNRRPTELEAAKALARRRRADAAAPPARQRPVGRRHPGV